MARVTVIMPAYNAEKFIEASVRCVLDQSFSDIELIVVNDGSTDRTGKILEALAAEDSRLTVLNVTNGGPARARNRALETVRAGSEYIMFVDADDELLPDAIEYAVGGSRDADLVFFGFSIVNPDGTERHYFESERHINSANFGENLPDLYKANLLNQVWGKLFRANLILDNGLSFCDYRWGEDRLFIYDCLDMASTGTVLPECKYRYIMHPGESLITKFYDRKLRVCIESDAHMEQICFRNGVKDEAIFKYMFAKSVFSCITTLFAKNCTLTHREKREYMRNLLYNEHVHRRCDGVFGGFAVNFLCAVVRTRNITLNLLVFRMVALVGKLAPKLFMAIKHKK